MSRIIKNAIMITSLHPSALVDMWADILYAVCDSYNHIIRAESLSTPEEILIVYGLLLKVFKHSNAKDG